MLTYPLLQIIRQLNPEAALKQTAHRDKSRLTRLPRLWFSQYSSVQAEIGLEKIDKVFNEDKFRVVNVDFLKANCGETKFPATTIKSKNVYWHLIVLVKNAVKAQAYFAKHGIDTATSSLELVCTLEDFPNKVDLPNAAHIYRNGILIPCFPNLTPSEKAQIATATRNYFSKHDNVR